MLAPQCCRAFRKEGGVHDPFAELTGLTKAPLKVSPPLKMRPATSTAAPAAATPAVPTSASQGYLLVHST